MLDHLGPSCTAAGGPGCVEHKASGGSMITTHILRVNGHIGNNMHKTRSAYVIT
jgi:hypothetical protein